MTAPDPYADLTLEELVARARAGDGGAFARLHDRYVDEVFRYVYLRVGGADLAEDLTAAAMLRVVRANSLVPLACPRDRRLAGARGPDSDRGAVRRRSLSRGGQTSSRASTRRMLDSLRRLSPISRNACPCGSCRASPLPRPHGFSRSSHRRCRAPVAGAALAGAGRRPGVVRDDTGRAPTAIRALAGVGRMSSGGPAWRTLGRSLAVRAPRRVPPPARRLAATLDDPATALTATGSDEAVLAEAAGRLPFVAVRPHRSSVRRCTIACSRNRPRCPHSTADPARCEARPDEPQLSIHGSHGPEAGEIRATARRSASPSSPPWSGWRCWAGQRPPWRRAGTHFRARRCTPPSAVSSRCSWPSPLRRSRAVSGCSNSPI